MNRVYLRGCEAKYFEPLLDTSDFCENPPASSRRLGRNGDEDAGGRHEGQDVPGLPAAHAETPPRTPASNTKRAALLSSRTRLRQSSSDSEGPGLNMSTKPETPGDYDDIIRSSSSSSSVDRDATGGAGSLVIHIRSGDIFLPLNAERMKYSFPGFGQVVCMYCRSTCTVNTLGRESTKYSDCV